MKFWNMGVSADAGAELRISGVIAMEQDFWDWLMDKPDHSAPAIIQAIEELDGSPLTVWINSNGGEVIAGSVIYTALKNYRGMVTVKIDGAAMSAASVIAMAGDRVLMSPTAVMMIHNPLTFVEGEAKDMQEALNMLSEAKESILNAYCKKTGLSRDKISALMDETTFMSADKAVELGFADGRLFDDETVTGDVMNGIVKGAKTLWNSCQVVSTDTAKLQAILNKHSENKEDFQTAQALLDIEKMRYGGI